MAKLEIRQPRQYNVADVSPFGDITDKREQLKLETQADLAKRFEADTSQSINWQPTFSRIKIKPDPEALSSVLDVALNDSLIRGTIVSVGPDVGLVDGRPVEKFYPGQRILYMRSHVMTYKGADGVPHHFLKENSDVSSIIAIEPRPVMADGNPVPAEVVQDMVAQTQMQKALAYKKSKK